MTKQDFIDGLRDLDIKHGDKVFVTSSLSRFGYVEGGAEAIVEVLKEYCSAVVMPSFNFSIFSKDKIVFNPDETPSEMGAITEAFRRSGVKRTLNLFHPLCYWGVDLSKCDTYDTWGEDSPYAYMSKNGFKMLMLGTNFYSCPIFHYCEQRNNVPYREAVEYTGKIGELEVKCRRLRRKYGDSDNNKAWWDAYTNEAKIGNAICRSFLIKDIVDFLDNKIGDNPEYLLLKNGLLSPMPTMDTIDIMGCIKELYTYPRYLVSDGFDKALEYLSRYAPLRIHKWKSGEKVWTWKVPLKEPEKVAGEMKVGEYTVKGFGDKTVLLPIHLDHVNMANDNLSGVAAAMVLIDRLQRTPDLRYSYKFLFVPETVGTIAYLDRFRKRYAYGIVLDSVGSCGDIKTTKTKFDSALNYYLTGKTNEFLSDEHLWTGNDERVLESVGIPSIQISRSVFLEYHTPQDNPSIISEKKILEAAEYAYSIISKLERDVTPKPTFVGIPCLSNYDLWVADIRLEKIWHLLHYNLSISQIAHMADLSFDYVYDFVNQMKQKGLVKC